MAIACFERDPRSTQLVTAFRYFIGQYEEAVRLERGANHELQQAVKTLALNEMSMQRTLEVCKQLSLDLHETRADYDQEVEQNHNLRMDGFRTYSEKRHLQLELERLRKRQMELNQLRKWNKDLPFIQIFI